MIRELRSGRQFHRSETDVSSTYVQYGVTQKLICFGRMFAKQSPRLLNVAESEKKYVTKYNPETFGMIFADFIRDFYFIMVYMRFIVYQNSIFIRAIPVDSATLQQYII